MNGGLLRIRLLYKLNDIVDGFLLLSVCQFCVQISKSSPDFLILIRMLVQQCKVIIQNGSWLRGSIVGDKKTFFPTSLSLAKATVNITRIKPFASYSVLPRLERRFSIKLCNSSRVKFSSAILQMALHNSLPVRSNNKHVCYFTGRGML